MANQQKVAEILVELKANMAQFKAAMGEATAITKQFSAQTRAEMGEAKASMALLGEEIGIKLPRHVRGFVAELPGVAKAMSLAFDTIAVFALISIVVEAGKKVYEFAEKASEAAKKNAEAWEKQHNTAETTVADLDLANIKLENQLAKLEHKPQNKIAEAIAETTAATAKLNTQLLATITSAQELLKASNVSLLNSIFKGQAGNGYEQTLMEQHRIHMAEAVSMQDKLNESQRFYNSLITRRNELEAMQNRKTSFVDASGQTHKINLWSGGDFRPEQNAVSEMLSGSRDEQSIISGTIQQSTLKGKIDTITGANDARSDRLKALQDEIEKRKALHTISINEEALYWQQHIAEFSANSKEYISVLKLASEAQDKLLENYWGKGKLSQQAKREVVSPLAEPEKAPAGYVISPDGTLSLVARGDEALAAANAKAAESQAKLNSEWTAATDKLQLLHGAITPHTAAMHEAAAHAEEYRLQIAALNVELKELAKDDDLIAALGGDPSHDAKEVQIKQQIAELESKAKIAQLEDSQNVLSTTWKGMVDSVWDELIRKAKDVQNELKQISLHTIDSLNGEIAKAMTGQKTNFSGVFEGAAQSLAKTSLQGVEGFGLKALGLGGMQKRDGQTEGGALLVQQVGSGGSSSLLSSGGKGLLGMLNDSDFFSGLFGGKLFGSGSLFGGGHAYGGDVMGGVPIDVGELGPERFVPSTNGKIVPNKDLKGSGTTMHIDARGTDPALTRENFARALQATHAQAVRDARQSMAESQRRRPQ
jgi:hypothetical protein